MEDLSGFESQRREAGKGGSKKGMGERGLGGLELIEISNLSHVMCDGQEEFREHSSQSSLLIPNPYLLR